MLGVARLGRDWYCRVQGNSIFRVPRPNEKISIGIDQLPESIRSSKVLTGNDLALLAGIENMPLKISDLNDNRIEAARQHGKEEVHRLAQQYLHEGKIKEAWSILLAAHE
jgi:hypothetical protein